MDREMNRIDLATKVINPKRVRRINRYLHELTMLKPLSEEWIKIEDKFLTSISNLGSGSISHYLKRYNSIGY